MKKTESESIPAVRQFISRILNSKKTAVIAGVILAAVTITAGYYTSPDKTELPVLLANGEVIMQPCYVAADGECIALVESEDAAEEVVSRVKDQYKSEDTIQVQIEEETSIENMELENGAEKPEILTPSQASEKIVENRSLTVKTTEVIEEELAVAYKTIEKKSDDLMLGETRTAQQGQAGVNRVKKEVVKKNGVVISESVLEQEVIVECVPEIIVSGTAGIVRPLDELRLTSGFGERWGRQHSGLDLGMPSGSPVYAAKTGIVTCASYCGSYGNLVKIDHGDGMETYYAHCSRLDVEEGQQVEAGQQIAAVGSTGNSTGPHLHFEIRIGGVAQDPAKWLDLAT